MNSPRTLWYDILINEKYTPLLFLIITVATFGLLANRLGFYQDDWPYVFYAFNKGIPSLKLELYYDSRPNAAWLYIAMFNVLGFRPVVWHWAALTLRWMTATVLWYFLKRLWREHTREATVVILLFLVHPFFLIQPYAVNSILYWAGYLFFSASLLIMTFCVREKKWQIPLTLTALLFEFIHLFTSEYFVGITLIRPMILFWLLKEEGLNLRSRIIKTLRNWLPYAIVLGSYVFWRLFLYIPSPTGDRNKPIMLFALLRTPFETGVSLIRTMLQDSLIITLTAWYRTLTPETLAFRSIFGWFTLGLIALSFLGIYLYLTHIPAKRTSPWLSTPLTLGCLILLLGMAPIWIIGQDIVTHKNQFAGSRYGIGSIFGAALIVATLIENIVDDNKKKSIVIASFMSLAIGMHLSNERDFSYAWGKQQSFSRQLVWRAPVVANGTAFVSDEEFLGYMGQYATAFSIMTAYEPGDIQKAPYWYFPSQYMKLNARDYLSGIPLEGKKLSMNFNGNSKRMLVLDFNPELNRCLWILQPQDASMRLISTNMRQLSSGSHIELIQQGDATLPESIYGKQENKGWCYFFEKADLARQYHQWAKITELWQDAQLVGERADNGFEYIPFIEGYGHIEDWKKVKELTILADRVTAGLRPSLCDALNRIGVQTPSSSEKNIVLQEQMQKLGCQP